MNIGSATLRTSIPAIQRQPTGTEQAVSEREPDSDRGDRAANLQPAAAKPLPAAVGKGLGLLVDVSL